MKGCKKSRKYDFKIIFRNLVATTGEGERESEREKERESTHTLGNDRTWGRDKRRAGGKRCATYFERYGKQGDEYVGKRQIGQIVIGDRSHPLAGNDRPYDQPVAGHGDHRYGPVQNGQDDHQQGGHLVQGGTLLVVRQRAVAVVREIAVQVDRGVYRDRGCGRGEGDSHCFRYEWRRRRRRLRRGHIGRAARDRRPLLVAGFSALSSSHVRVGSAAHFTRGSRDGYGGDSAPGTPRNVEAVFDARGVGSRKRYCRTVLATIGDERATETAIGRSTGGRR